MAKRQEPTAFEPVGLQKADVPLTSGALVEPGRTRRSPTGRSGRSRFLLGGAIAPATPADLTASMSDIPIDGSLDGIDWARCKADLAADEFDNGRTPAALQRSFANSAHVAIARDGQRVVGMARLISDGVCNAYLLDVWTLSAYRRQGIGARMVQALVAAVPGQHIGLQTDDAQHFYTALGFAAQPEFLSRVSGTWLDNAANR